jgi:hypothetical protein
MPFCHYQFQQNDCQHHLLFKLSIDFYLRILGLLFEQNGLRIANLVLYQELLLQEGLCQTIRTTVVQI